MIEYIATFFATVSLIAIPIYLSNGLALILGGGKAIDFGMVFYDGRPLLGKGKTFRGTLAGIFFGSVGAAIVSSFLPQLTSYLPINYLYYGILLATGAMAGDIAGSFVKRRFGLGRGYSALLLDQLDFLAGGIILGGIMFAPTILEVLFLAVFTLSIHKFANMIAYKTNIKKVPW